MTTLIHCITLTKRPLGRIKHPTRQQPILVILWQALSQNMQWPHMPSSI